MKIAFVSDIHGGLSALEEVMQQLERWNPDRIILVGDLMYHGPRNPLPTGYDPAGVAALLNQKKDIICAVRGNCDSEVDQMLCEFPMMADYAELQLADNRFFVTHGHLQEPENHQDLTNGSVFTSGHTHLPIAEKRDDIFYFNPGSISLPKGGNPPSYGKYENGLLEVVSLEGNTLKSVNLD